MIKINIHSVVDLITNSSTTVFIYQNCIDEAKELVQEVLNLSGITDKTPDDIFYYGVFCDRYLDYINDEYQDEYLDYINDECEDDEEEMDKSIFLITTEYGTPEREKQKIEQEKWLENLICSIIKGESEKPDWMERAETISEYGYDYDTELILITKDEKYQGLADKIQKLLNGVGGEGFRDG